MTKEAAIEFMKGKGYKMVSEAGNESWVGFAKDMRGIWMTATVFLTPESVSMTGGTLKMMCKLTCEKFDMHSKRFADFENVLYLYAKICSQIDNLVDAEGIVKQTFGQAAKAIRIEGVNDGDDEGVKQDKNSLEARMAKFKDEVIAIGKEKGYPPAMCKKFFTYWSETNPQGKKMRWEIQKTKSGVFNTKGRMVTWYGKEGDYNSTFKDRDEKKADKQNQALKKTPTVIDKNELF